MPYYVIDDWRGGWDLRRLPAVASPTTLLQIDNAHINPGGEIEKRKAFVPYGPANGTFGLASDGEKVVVFGNTDNPLPTNTPLRYQKLRQEGEPEAIPIKLLDWDLYDGLIYAVTEDAAGVVHHWYDGVLVQDPLANNPIIETFEEKIYGVLRKNLSFTAVGDPTIWTPDPAPPDPDPSFGAGSINLSTRDSDSANLTGLEIYYDLLAVFSPRAVQFWRVDPDPLQNRLVQVLRATGTEAGRSVKQFGGGDVLYLDSTGIRSLRARDSSNSASLSDIGSPIDAKMQELRLSDPTAYRQAISVVEQGTGRFWMFLGGNIYVLSYFPGPDVTAWSRYVPKIPISDLTAHQITVACRGVDNTIYLYGGEDYNTYDDAKVTVQTPFLHIDSPATTKYFDGMDIAGSSVWGIEANFVPSEPYVEENWQLQGNFIGTTYQYERMALSGSSTHVAFRMTNQQDGPALLSNMATHYSLGDAG